MLKSQISTSKNVVEGANCFAPYSRGLANFESSYIEVFALQKDYFFYNLKEDHVQ